MPPLSLSLLFLATLAGCANAQYGGRVALDGRAFVLPAAVEGQEQGSGGSLMADPSFSIQSDDGDHTATVQPFVRGDLVDENRTQFDLRQADYLLSTGPVEVGVGVGQFNWGVMESHRPVDVVNQLDLAEDHTGQAKLGQPYLRLALLDSDWSLEALALPVNRPRTFAGEQGRLRGYLPVDDEPLFDQELGVFFPSAAARFALTVGNVDLGVTAFSGIGREPRFFAQLTGGGVNASYERLHQAGVDVQLTEDAITLRVEAVGRLWSRDSLPSFAVSLGAERAFLDIGGADLVLVAEYHLDNRGPEQPFTLYNNDGFAGFRLELNDDEGTAFGGGVLVDFFTGMTYARAFASRRLHENWTVSLEGHGFFGQSPGLESALESDHFLAGRLAYFF